MSAVTEIDSVVLRAIGDVCGSSKEDIKPGSLIFSELGVDSLGLIVVFEDIESELGPIDWTNWMVDLEPNELEELTLTQLVTFVSDAVK